MHTVEREDLLGDILVLPPQKVILEWENWTVVEAIFTPPKISWLWKQMNQRQALFSDLTRGNIDNFFGLISKPHSYWMEVRENGETVGMIYLEGLEQQVDCEAHIMFFDSKLKSKVVLCQRLMKFVFNKFALHRMTVRMPVIYHAITRFAYDVGFKSEGRRRKVYLLKGEWVDEVILGMLATEVPDGR